MNSREAKLRAKEILSEGKNQLILITCLSLILMQVPSFVLNLTGVSLKMPLLALIIGVVVLVIQRGIIFALTKIYIAKKNGEEVGTFAFLSEGFKELKRAWAISFRLIPKLIVPILCYVVAAVLSVVGMVGAGGAVLSSAMTSTGYMDVATTQVAGNMAGVLGIMTVILYFVAFIFIIRVSYQYRYADIEAINNPYLTTKEVIQRTGEIMEGNRFKSFKLDLSFLLWAFLVGLVGGLLGGLIPVVGILILYWVVALIQVNLMMAHIVFYEDLSSTSFDAIPDYSRRRDENPEPLDTMGL